MQISLPGVQQYITGLQDTPTPPSVPQSTVGAAEAHKFTLSSRSHHFCHHRLFLPSTVLYHPLSLSNLVRFLRTAGFRLSFTVPSLRSSALTRSDSFPTFHFLKWLPVRMGGPFQTWSLTGASTTPSTSRCAPQSPPPSPLSCQGSSECPQPFRLILNSQAALGLMLTPGWPTCLEHSLFSTHLPSLKSHCVQHAVT